MPNSDAYRRATVTKEVDEEVSPNATESVQSLKNLRLGKRLRALKRKEAFQCVKLKSSMQYEIEAQPQKRRAVTRKITPWSGEGVEILVKKRLKASFPAWSVSRYEGLHVCDTKCSEQGFKFFP